MSRKVGDNCTFRQRDVKAAIKAARAAGLENFRIEVDQATGRISVVTMKPYETVQKGDHEWDDDL
ncbi:conserved hypothetical protein [Bradyrhizobium sp. STM 3843]|uniref:hypothetical protein n=1 Tax=Bradyrhizobium sp. STM 3843 TaxID=551947 RepID=UPI0002403D90|nr:hypothetical protein [Bradyrhizobium sp. STM 3843]CCE11552.1 conserved hypothetical protein [Bradyrhizobium sp. STM 3843]